jgi:hypothetical protein
MNPERFTQIDELFLAALDLMTIYLLFAARDALDGCLRANVKKYYVVCKPCSIKYR